MIRVGCRSPWIVVGKSQKLDPKRLICPMIYIKTFDALPPLGSCIIFPTPQLTSEGDDVEYFFASRYYFYSDHIECAFDYDIDEEHWFVDRTVPKEDIEDAMRQYGWITHNQWDKIVSMYSKKSIPRIHP